MAMGAHMLNEVFSYRIWHGMAWYGIGRHGMRCGRQVNGCQNAINAKGFKQGMRQIENHCKHAVNSICVRISSVILCDDE